MSFEQVRGTSYNPSTAYGTFPETATRQEKTNDFISNALPAGLLAGLQGFRQPATATAAATTTSAAGAATALGTAASFANILTGIYGGLELAVNWGHSSPTAGASSGMALGASIGTLFCPGLGTAIGAGIGAIAGGLIGAISSGKHKDQKVRDRVRDMLVSARVLNEDFTLPLANGSRYDMGKDGGPRDELGGRRAFEVDFNNPLAQYAVAWMNPIIELLSQGNEKIKTDFVGYFANAAISGATSLQDVKRNVDSFMARFGISNEKLAQAVAYLAQSGRVNQETARAYMQAIYERANSQFPTNEALVHQSVPSPAPAF